MGIKNYTPFIDINLAIQSLKLHIPLPFVLISFILVNPLLEIYPKVVLAKIQKARCKKFFTILSVIAKGWKQPECPSVGNRLNKQVTSIKFGTTQLRKGMRSISIYY